MADACSVCLLEVLLLQPSPDHAAWPPTGSTTRLGHDKGFETRDDEGSGGSARESQRGVTSEPSLEEQEHQWSPHPRLREGAP